jgi:hypothetical protein
MMEDPDPHADLKQHRLTPETRAMIDQRRVAFVPKKIRKRHQHFVQMPMWWVERRRGASGQTHQVALHLLYLHWRNKGPVKLPNGRLEIDGISRYAKWRALADLEKKRGLITVERRSRKSPIVRLNMLQDCGK